MRISDGQLRLFGHVQSRVSGYMGQSLLKIRLPSRRKRARPERKFMGVVMV